MVGCSSPAGCHPQAPVLLLPPGLWLAQQLARPSLTTAVQRALLRSKAPGCQSSWLLFAPVLGQMALKQLIFKRGFIAKSQSSLQAGAKVLPFLWLRQLLLGESSTFACLQAHFLPVTNVTWWHGLKHSLTPQCSMPTGLPGTRRQL